MLMLFNSERQCHCPSSVNCRLLPPLTLPPVLPQLPQSKMRWRRMRGATSVQM